MIWYGRMDGLIGPSTQATHRLKAQTPFHHHHHLFTRQKQLKNPSTQPMINHLHHHHYHQFFSFFLFLLQCQRTQNDFSDTKAERRKRTTRPKTGASPAFGLMKSAVSRNRLTDDWSLIKFNPLQTAHCWNDTHSFTLSQKTGQLVDLIFLAVQCNYWIFLQRFLLIV